MTEYIVKCKKFTGIAGNELEFPEYIDKNQEIVRCRDCERFDGEHEGCRRFSHYVDPDGFCAWGKRKEVDA